MASPSSVFRIWILLVILSVGGGLYGYLTNSNKPQDVVILSSPAALDEGRRALLSEGHVCSQLLHVRKCTYSHGDITFLICGYIGKQEMMGETRIIHKSTGPGSTEIIDESQIYTMTSDDREPPGVFQKVAKGEKKEKRFKKFKGDINVCPPDPFPESNPFKTAK